MGVQVDGWDEVQSADVLRDKIARKVCYCCRESTDESAHIAVEPWMLACYHAFGVRRVIALSRAYLAGDG